MQDSHSEDTTDNKKAMDQAMDPEKEKKLFIRRKTCWFCAKRTTPDWKDTQSYLWLVNEFGKISPSRITGLCSKHQRVATNSIKRARCIGFISRLTNQVIH